MALANSKKTTRLSLFHFIFFSLDTTFLPVLFSLYDVIENISIHFLGTNSNCSSSENLPAFSAKIFN